MQRTRRRRRALAAALTALAVASPALPGRALAHDGGFGPSQTLATGYVTTLKAAVGADGRVRGFVSGPGLRPGPNIHTDIGYLVGRGRQWRTTRTPYVGDVLAVAHDETGTYVLFDAPDGLRLAKRTTSGVYTAGHLLLRRGAPSRTTSPPGFSGADLVAEGGRWWAVWSVSRDEPSQLHEAGTMGGRPWSGRVSGDSRRHDSGPTLALEQGPGRRAVLVWTRDGDLWSAVSVRPGGWRQPQRLARQGYEPDLAITGRTWHLVWTRSSRSHAGFWYAEGARSALRSTRLSQHYGAAALLAVSGGRVSVAFDAPLGDIQVRQRSRPGAPWTTTTLWRRTYDWRPAAMTAYRGRASVFVATSKSMLAVVRSQER